MKTREDIMMMVHRAYPMIYLLPVEGCAGPLLCGYGTGYRCELHGPFYDVTPHARRDEHTERIYVVYRLVDEQESFQLLVQDADDDVFLSHDAEGAEKYDLGVTVVKTHD